MINQLLRLGFLVAAGRFLKSRYKGLLALILVWFVLWFLNSQYVQYVALSEDRSFVLYASIIKVTLYAVSVFCYVFLVERPLWPKSVKPPVVKARPAPVAPAAHGGAATSPMSAKPRALEEGDDGFDFLRRKDKLESPSEKLLNK